MKFAIRGFHTSIPVFTRLPMEKYQMGASKLDTQSLINLTHVTREPYK